MYHHDHICILADNEIKNYYLQCVLLNFEDVFGSRRLEPQLAFNI